MILSALFEPRVPSIAFLAYLREQLYYYSKILSLSCSHDFLLPLSKQDAFTMMPPTTKSTVVQVSPNLDPDLVLDLTVQPLCGVLQTRVSTSTKPPTSNHGWQL
jgi:hypothetical protein